MRLLARIATAAAGVLIGLGLAEALLSPWPPALTSSWILATRDRVRDPDLIYVNPRLERRSYYTVDPSLPTIVALGDSFTEGFPVDRARSYPSALRRMLASRGQRTNVVSLGLGDSGPDQQLRLFQRNVLERGWIRPDVVVWQLYNNDAWDNALKSVYAIAAQGLEPVPAARNWMYRRQLLFDRTPLPRWFKLHSNIFGYALKSIEHWRLAQVPEAYAADPQGWGLEKIRLELHALDELGKAHGFRSYYTVVPPQSSYANASDCAGVVDGEATLQKHAKLRAVVAAMPRYIDIDFGHDRARSSCRRFYVDGARDVSVFGNRHLNEAGYRLMARLIARRLLDDGALASHRDG